VGAAIIDANTARCLFDMFVHDATHISERLFERMGNYFESMFGNKLQVACGGIIAFCATIYTMAFGEGQQVIGLVLFAVISMFFGDMLLGIMIAIRNGSFTSRGFSRSLEKVFVYTLAITGMTAFGVIVPAVPLITGIDVPITIVVASARAFFMWTLLLVGLTEFISIVENLKCLGFRLPDQVYRVIDIVKKKIGQALPGAENGKE
jgi:phage-related holin